MNDFDSIITVTHVGPEDYTGEDGLLYCGKCRTPKQFRMDAAPLEGRLLPCPCRCEQERIDRGDYGAGDPPPPSGRGRSEAPGLH